MITIRTTIILAACYEAFLEAFWRRFGVISICKNDNAYKTPQKRPNVLAFSIT